MLIELEKLTLKNFLSVSNKPIELVFNEYNKTLVTGPNGSGKSSLLIDGVTYALFGKPFRNINKPQLINDVNKKELNVELEFNNGKHHYKIIRGMKPNILELYRDDKLIDQEAAFNDYQKYIESNIIKMNIETFKQIVILGSGGYTPFMRLTPAKRRSVIEDLLGISFFSKMSAINKVNLKQYKDDLKYAKLELNSSLSNLEIYQKYEKDNSKQRDEKLTKLQAELYDNIQDYKNGEQNLNKVIERIQKFEENLDPNDYNEEYAQLKADLSGLETEIRLSKKTINYVNNHDVCEYCKQSIEEDEKRLIIDTETQKINELIPKVDDIKCKIKDVTKRIRDKKDFDSKYQKLKQLEKTLSVKQDSMKKHLYRIRDDVIEIKNKSENEDFKQKIIDINKEIEEKEVRVKTCDLNVRSSDILYELLKDSGVKKLIIKKYIPTLNKLINKYIRMLGGDYNFTIDDEFNEHILSRGREGFGYNSFSEGQKARIDISFMFAFRELIQAKTGSLMNVLILDEILDGSYDESGIKLLNKILNSLPNNNIFIISHSDKHDGFDNHIKVDLVGQFTRIEQAGKI